MNNHLIPAINGQVSVPGVTNTNQGTNPSDPNLAFINLVLRPCADSVAKWLPILQREGVNITSQVVMERIFATEFQSLASSNAYIQALPASGIRKPKTRTQPLAPGNNLQPVPGIDRLYYPDPDKEDKCMWRNTRGKNSGQQCPKDLGSNGIYCEGCSAKKTAIKYYTLAENATHGAIQSGLFRGTVRDYVFSLRGGAAPPVSSTGRPVAAGAVPPKNTSQLSVSHYPGSKGLLFISAEGVVYTHDKTVSPNSTVAIGMDVKKTGKIMPISPQEQPLVKQGIKIDDSLAREYVNVGGLDASLLDISGKLKNSMSVQPAVPQVPVAQPQPTVPQVPVAQPQPTVPQVPVAQPQPMVPQVPVAQPQPTVPQVPVAQPQPTVAQVPVAQPQPMVPQGMAEGNEPVAPYGTEEVKADPPMVTAT